MNLREFIKDVAPIVISVLAITMGATWGIRETWANNSHLADAEIYNSAIQSKSLNTSDSPPDTPELIAENWISISEDFRRAAIYMSLATGDQMIAILMFSISYEYAVGDEDSGRTRGSKKYISTVFFLLGFVFVLFSTVAVAYKYRYWRLGSIPGYEALSWCVADLFPSRILPLPPLIAPCHLEVSGQIMQNLRLRTYLESLPDYQDTIRLRELAGIANNTCGCGIWPVALVGVLAVIMALGIVMYTNWNLTIRRFAKRNRPPSSITCTSAGIRESHVGPRDKLGN